MDFKNITGNARAKKFANLISAVNRTAQNKKSDFKDENQYYPERDSDGNAQAIIRFLPGLEVEDEPCFIELFNHGFKGTTGKWYIENCPTTIECDCPVCKANSAIVNTYGGWESTPKADKTIVRVRKRKQGFFSNILVVKDKVNPENEGRVFKFRFGQKILEKILGKINPEFDDVDPVNVFDYKEGANFRLVIRKVEGYANYDKSEFDMATPLTAKEIKEVKEKQHKLLDMISSSNFKDFETLSEKFETIMGGNTESTPAPKEKSAESLPIDDVPMAKDDAPISAEGDDSDLDYFKNLADEVV